MSCAGIQNFDDSLAASGRIEADYRSYGGGARPMSRNTGQGRQPVVVLAAGHTPPAAEHEILEGLP